MHVQSCGRREKIFEVRQKKIWIPAVLILLLIIVFIFYTFDSFRHKGIDQALVGQVEEDKYPDWDNWTDSEKVSEMEYDIVSKKGLRVSELYLIQRAGHYQLRFRIAPGMPFSHPDLMRDTDWSIEDSVGSSYTSNLLVYGEQMGGWNCINVTLLLNGEEFSGLSGKELNLTAVCSESEEADMENGYAHCELKIQFP